MLCASADKLKALDFIPKQEQYEGILKTIHWHFREKAKKSGQLRQTAVVTGGASGIGKALCKKLYAQGYSITIVDRNETQAKQVTQKLNGQVYCADLSREEDIESFVDYLQENANTIDILVNNAGIGKKGLFWEISPSDSRDIVMVNCLSPILLTRAIPPIFLRANMPKTIITIASSAAYQPLPYMSVYSASKAMILNFSEALIGEILGSNQNAVEIITVSPSGTATNFQTSAGVNNENSERLLSADSIARKIVKTIGNGSQSIIIGKSGKSMMMAARLFPRKLQIRLWEKLMREMR